MKRDSLMRVHNRYSSEDPCKIPVYAVDPSRGEVEVGTDRFSYKTVVTPTERKVEVVSGFSKGTAAVAGRPGRTQEASGDDYRKWPCICRNYRNNGNKKTQTQRSTLYGSGVGAGPSVG